MESHNEPFNNNTFEILMDQLQATCPPGFLTTKDEKIEANEVNPLDPPILEKNRSRLPESHHEALRISLPTQKRSVSSSTPPYRPPSSPASPRYRPPSSSRSYFPLSSPSPYRPPVSPRAPSFERNRSFNQPRKNSRRLYVFNIPNDTTEQRFREYFGKFGTLTSCGFDTEDSVNKDSKSGFVAFEKSSMTEHVLENSQHLKLDGQSIRVKRATSQKTQLFVGGYDLYASKTELIAFFSKFGEVCDFVMKFNSEGVNRCFGFVTFRDSEDAVNRLVEERFLECMGKTVEIKRATQTKRSYTPYGGTPMARRVPSSPRFNRDSLEFRKTPSMSPRADRIRLSSSSNSHDLDVQIDGTRMYSRKFFAPTRRGMNTNKKENN